MYPNSEKNGFNPASQEQSVQCYILMNSVFLKFLWPQNLRHLTVLTTLDFNHMEHIWKMMFKRQGSFQVKHIWTKISGLYLLTNWVTLVLPYKTSEFLHLRHSSVDKALIAEAWRQDPQHPHKSRVWMNIPVTSVLWGRDNWIFGVHWTASLAKAMEL